jgi:repressor LexA
VISVSIGRRIHSERLKKDMTLEDLAKIVGVSRQTLSRYETGVISNIPSDKIEQISEALNTTPAYLMGWEAPAPEIPEGFEPPPRWVRKPLLGNIACGLPILAVENVEEYILVPENIHCDFLLRCKGDSMINARIMDGDIVMIRHQEDVENGEIAAVRIDGEVTLKRVYKQPGMVQLVAENPTFPIKVYNNGNCSDFCIVGKAIAFLSLVR